MKIRYTAKLILFVYALSAAIDVYACLTTFINDKVSKILIYNKNDNTIIPIQKNERRRFGSPHEHAHFAVYMQQPKNQYFYRAYVCKQNECGRNGNVQLALSDIENGTGPTNLFTITQEDPHVSMVNTLPMLKKNCRKCTRRSE